MVAEGVAAGAQLSKLQGSDTVQGTWEMLVYICFGTGVSDGSDAQQGVHTGAIAPLHAYDLLSVALLKQCAFNFPWV